MACEITYFGWLEPETSSLGKLWEYFHLSLLLLIFDQICKTISEKLSLSKNNFDKW